MTRTRISYARSCPATVSAALVLALSCGGADVMPDGDPAALTEAAHTAGEAPVIDAGVVGAPQGPPVGVPATALPLSLLATLSSDNAEGSDPRATIRDDDAGVIASYRVGDAVRSGVAVVEVGRGFVLLENGNQRERLTIGVDPVALDARDVLYPDLADDLSLPNSMEEAVQLTPGPGYTIKTPAFAWGTPRTVHVLRETLREYWQAHPESPEIFIGDISRRQGGPFPPHLSHQNGRDVDVSYVLQSPFASSRRFVRATEFNLDRQRTWDLLELLLDGGSVRYVFIDYEIQALLFEHAVEIGVDPAWLEDVFQYPRGRGMAVGVIRHWRSHRNHFHVRFYE